MVRNLCAHVCICVYFMFHRCIIWPRWGWFAHGGCVRGPPGGSECHADPQRAAVHVLRRPDCQSLPPGGGCYRISANALIPIFLWMQQTYVLSFLLQTHECVGVFEGHSSKVSCLYVSAAPGLHHRLYSGSSDQTIRCYSLRVKTRIFFYWLNRFRFNKWLSLHYSMIELIILCLIWLDTRYRIFWVMH